MPTAGTNFAPRRAGCFAGGLTTTGDQSARRGLAGVRSAPSVRAHTSTAHRCQRKALTDRPSRSRTIGHPHGGMKANRNRSMPGTFTAAQRRRLHSCLGIAPGTGKANAMLAEANRVAGQGIDVVGLVGTHNGADTRALLATLERIPPRRIRHRGGTFDELDVDAVSRRHPWDVLVDKPAHTCVRAAVTKSAGRTWKNCSTRTSM